MLWDWQTTYIKIIFGFKLAKLVYEVLYSEDFDFENENKTDRSKCSWFYSGVCEADLCANEADYEGIYLVNYINYIWN